MLQHPAAHYGVERSVGIRQTRQVSHDMTNACTAKPSASTLQHAWRQIEARDECIGVSVAEQETRIAAIATTSIENTLTATHIERPGTDESASQRFMPRH